MKNIIPLILILLSCSQKENNDVLATDDASVPVTAAAETTPITPPPAEVVEVTNWSTPVADVSGLDSLFNILVRKQAVRGTFGGIKLITEKLLDLSQNESRNLFAVLVTSGEGEGYNTRFATEYAVVAVFELKEGQVTLLDYADLGESGSYGLQVATTEADSMMLAENRFAMVIHNKSSEEGAGDSGYRRDFAQLYVFLDNKITKAFEKTIDDFSFASDESGYYRETTITTKLTVLPEKTNGLFNIMVTTSGDRRVIDGEEDNQGEYAAPESDEAPDGMYQWNGKVYEKVE